MICVYRYIYIIERDHYATRPEPPERSARTEQQKLVSPLEITHFLVNYRGVPRDMILSSYLVWNEGAVMSCNISDMRQTSRSSGNNCDSERELMRLLREM